MIRSYHCTGEDGAGRSFQESKTSILYNLYQQIKCNVPNITPRSAWYIPDGFNLFKSTLHNQNDGTQSCLKESFLHTLLAAKIKVHIRYQIKLITSGAARFQGGSWEDLSLSGTLFPSFWSFSSLWSFSSPCPNHHSDQSRHIAIVSTRIVVSDIKMVIKSSSLQTTNSSDFWSSWKAAIVITSAISHFLECFYNIYWLWGPPHSAPE